MLCVTGKNIYNKLTFIFKSNFDFEPKTRERFSAVLCASYFIMYCDFYPRCFKY